jgi:phosphohistidine swiveling domain-containing protein
MEKNFSGNKIKWLWVMKKLNTPLSVSSYPIGTETGKSAFGYPECLTATWYDFGDIYFDQEEIDVIKRFLEYKLDTDKSYPAVISKRIFKLAGEIKKQEINTNKLKYSTLTLLLKYLQVKSNLFLQMIGFMSYRGSIQMGDILQDKISNILSYHLSQESKLFEYKKYFELLSRPSFSSIIGEEKEYALKQSINFKNLNNKQQQSRIAAYLENFKWMSYHWFVGTPPREAEIRLRLLKLSPIADKELKRIKQEKNETEKEITKVSKELKLIKSERNLLGQYRTWLFLRTFVKDNINLAAYKLLPILYQIADQVKIERKMIVYLTLDEINNIVKISKNDLLKKINSRKNGFSAGIINKRFVFRVFQKPFEQKVEKNNNKVEFRGMSAYRGKVKGIVRVLQSPKEKDQFKKGEILVTAMTTPDYLSAMEKASAFITDEGGITCHAAIMAREMKKTCIIGTKIATKVLKNGDLVEVDANKGIVKIIK